MKVLASEGIDPLGKGGRAVVIAAHAGSLPLLRYLIQYLLENPLDMEDMSKLRNRNVLGEALVAAAGKGHLLAVKLLTFRHRHGNVAVKGLPTREVAQR